mmetsp:Transcript_41409/g.119843  ORF Transcript_41409/g.119843 Transcript_41409/m.119843 type:complete len:184 (-) Transcript_41409:29-580(-)
MLLPMPPLPSGPPTEYAMSRRWLLLVILVLQTVVCTLRIVLLEDIIGGFIMAIGIGVGWYAYSEGMNITYACSWGMMSLVNGAFDLVKLINVLVKTHLPLFSSHRPWAYNLLSALELSIPLVGLAGAVLAWFMYKAHAELDQPDWAGSAFDERRPLARGPEERPSRPSSGFTAFAGSGRRLGS